MYMEVEPLFPERSSVPAAYSLFDAMILVAVEMIKLSSTDSDGE